MEVITAGRLVFNQEVVPEPLRYVNKTMEKNSLIKLISEAHDAIGNEGTIILLDAIKSTGLQMGVQGGHHVLADRHEIAAVTRRDPQGHGRRSQ